MPIGFEILFENYMCIQRIADSKFHAMVSTAFRQQVFASLISLRYNIGCDLSVELQNFFAKQILKQFLFNLYPSKGPDDLVRPTVLDFEQFTRFIVGHKYWNMTKYIKM